MPRGKARFNLNIQGTLLAGILTITPLAAVWLVFNFLLGILSATGAPLASPLARAAQERWPQLGPWLAEPWVQWFVAVMVSLVVLYAIGAVTSRVIGARLFALFERVVERIPLVDTIYNATKKLVDVLRQKPESSQRVVLLDFPREGLKTLGFVMRTFADAQTGEELAAVYVPTALNPTSGFLEIVPVAKLIASDIPTDQAMTMIISSGAVMPERFSLNAQAAQ
ncbi:MAG TPA: DUF502 domain-containing protein [Rhizomicrobium sp.]|jgi:uncharacterized membrane protein